MPPDPVGAFGGFAAQMFNRRTALEPTTKLSYKALNPLLRQAATVRLSILSANLVLHALFRYTNLLRCLSSLLIHLNAQKIVERVLVREHNLRYENLEPF
jgi:hypothetical protein